MDACAPPRPCAGTLLRKGTLTLHLNAPLRVSAVRRAKEQRDDIELGLPSPWLAGPGVQAPGVVSLVVVEAEGVSGYLSS